MRTLILKFGKFIFALLIIGYLIHKGFLDPKGFEKLLNFNTISLCLLFTGIGFWFQAWRWKVLLNTRALKISLWESLQLFFIGNFFNYVLPGSVGGDVVRGYYLVQIFPKRRVDAILSVIMDRLLGLYGMLLVAFGAMVLNWDMIQKIKELRSVFLITTLLLLAANIFFITSLSRRANEVIPVKKLISFFPFSEKILKIYEAFHSFGNNKKVIVQSILLSFCAQVTSLSFMVFIGNRLGESALPLGAYFFAVPLGFIISSIPIAPAGLGVGQVAFLMLFRSYTQQQTQVGQIAITAYQATLFLWGIMGAIFYLNRNVSLQKTLPSPEESFSIK
ncbi:MAG: flippase-like domain-containing protein [Bdellovibrionales bacterium]|nr:flippase-like domain-containing protein [Bdellovibrionales bacterium]